MAISEMIGGMSQLTAVFVVLTALTGALLYSLIRICRIKTAIAKGIMLGTSANGTGTSKAFEIHSCGRNNCKFIHAFNSRR